MSKNKSIIILLVIAVVLVGAYFAVTHFIQQPADEDMVEKFKDISLLQVSEDELENFEMSNNNGILKFIRSNDTWTIEGAEGIELDDTLLSDIVYYFTTVAAEQEIGDATQDLKQFGLDNPSSVITIRLKDGTERIFFLGNEAPSNDSHYFMEKDGDKIYTINSSRANQYLKQLSDFRNPQVLSLSANTINGLTIRSNGKTFTAKKETVEGTETWKLIVPYEISANAEKITEDILTPLSSIKADAYIEDNTKDFSKYGLSTPLYTVEVSYNDNQQLTIYFGKTADEYTCFRIGSSQNVYGALTSSLSFLDVKAVDYINKIAFIPNIDEVKTIDISYQSQKYHLEFSVNSEEKVYRINGQDASEEKMRTLYSDLFYLPLVDELSEAVNTAAEVTFRVTYQDDRNPDTLELKPVDDRKYAFVLNGDGYFYVNKKSVTDAMAKLSDFASNPN